MTFFWTYSKLDMYSWWPVHIYHSSQDNNHRYAYCHDNFEHANYNTCGYNKAHDNTTKNHFIITIANITKAKYPFHNYQTWCDMRTTSWWEQAWMLTQRKWLSR